jgi:hypothetical protein
VEVVCARFSFRASGRAEIVEARKAFHEASILLGNDFSDTSITSTGGMNSSIWSYTRAEIRINAGRIVLGGHSDYPDEPDPGSDMWVYLYEYQAPGEAKACGAQPLERYAQVRELIGKRWKISVEKG